MSNHMATIHLTGNMASTPEMKHRTENAAMAVFRLAVNHRYQDRHGTWVDGDPTFVTVQCWGKLAKNIVSDGFKGMPVVVVGRLYQSTWTVQDTGEQRSALRIRASHVGADMTLRRVAVTKEEAANTAPAEDDKADQPTVAIERTPGAADDDGPGRSEAAGSENPEGELVGAGASTPPF